jgi:drug/metabolite transporter (DMT)-like permease
MDANAAEQPVSEVHGWLAFATCAAIWGSTFLVISIGNDTVPPMWAATIRLVLASVLLTALALVTGQGLPRGAAFRAAAGFGFLNFGISFVLLYWGETIVPSGLSAVVYGTVPLSTALFARAFGLEALRPLKLLGALVALGGVAVLFSSQLRAGAPALPLLAIFGAATSASLSGVVLKRGPRQPPLGVNAVGAWAGLPVCLAASWLTGEPHALPRGAEGWLPILYLTVVGSFGAFVVYAWLVNRWKLTRISFIAVIVPIVALILGAVFRGERLGAGALLGTLLVFGGLGLSIASDRASR